MVALLALFMLPERKALLLVIGPLICAESFNLFLPLENKYGKLQSFFQTVSGHGLCQQPGDNIPAEVIKHR